MPRTGSGVYNQPFPNVISDTTIESAVYNGFTRDVETDLNTPRPIVAGGTGATNAAEALENLHGVSDTGDTMTGNLEIDKADPNLILNKKLSGQFAAVTGQLADKNRWRITLGDSGGESTAGTNVGSNFTIGRYDDAGALIDAPFSIARDTGKAAIIGKVTITSTTTPPPPPPGVAVDAAQLTVNKPASGVSAAILGATNGLARWRLILGDVTTESGTNVGSNFRIDRFDNAGAFLDIPLYIERSTGRVVITGNATQPAPMLAINKTAPAGSQASSIQGQTSGTTRWQMALGDTVAETGSNTGSHFRLQRYDDGGNLIDIPMVINRTTGVTTFNGSPPDQYPIVVINKTSGSGAQSAALFGAMQLSSRWSIALGDGTPETGSNIGSHFKINRFTDSGAFNGFSLYIGRHDNTFAVTTDNALKPSGGSWIASSDARIKTVLGDYQQGLDAIKALQPVIYKYTGNDVQFPGPVPSKVGKGQPDPESSHYTVATENKEFIGLIAQDAEVPMPELVQQIRAKIDGVMVNDYRVLDPSAVMWALVNAVKELAARVEALEAAR
jgi:Chaperone of endosialidase